MTTLSRLLLLALLMASCTTSFMDGLPEAGSLTLPATIQDDASPAVLYGHAKVHYAPSIAQVAGGLPIVIVSTRPVAGQPFRAGFTTRPTAPLVHSPTAMLLTFTKPGEPVLIPGGLGGMLMVPIIPSTTIVVPTNGTPVTQFGGEVEISITFPASLVGLRMWTQLLVADTRTPAGLTVSPMLEMVVGSR
jgi:hypothetical protein